MMGTERGAGHDVPITSVEVSAYTIPTDRPEGDGTLTWDSTTWVLVSGLATMRCRRSLGCTHPPASAAAVVGDLLAEVMIGRSALDVRAPWGAMVRAVRNAAERVQACVS